MTSSTYTGPEPITEPNGAMDDVYTASNHELAVPRLAEPDPATVFAKGLCQQCALATTCTFPRNWERPILACEEFQGEEKPVALHVVGVLTPTGFSRSQPTHVSGAAERSLEGLCATCEKRDTCTFPGRETGIWQCEEFE